MGIRKVMVSVSAIYKAVPLIVVWLTRGLELLKDLMVALTKSKKF